MSRLRMMEGCVTRQLRMALDCRVRGTCPCCREEDVVLVRHHWTEEDGSQYEKMTCIRCNSMLHSRRFGHFGPEWNHVLPSWEEQVRAVKESREAAMTRSYLALHPEIYESVKQRYKSGELVYS